MWRRALPSGAKPGTAALTRRRGKRDAVFSVEAGFGVGHVGLDPGAGRPVVDQRGHREPVRVRDPLGVSDDAKGLAEDAWFERFVSRLGRALTSVPLAHKVPKVEVCRLATSSPRYRESQCFSR